jgi:hypothetical protein
MDSYWKEIVINIMPLVNTLEFRVLNKTCLALCEERINVTDLIIIIRFFNCWKSKVKRRPLVNSWMKTAARSREDRYILCFS